MNPWYHLSAAITRAESAEAQAAALSSGGSEEVKTLQHKLQETQVGARRQGRDK